MSIDGFAFEGGDVTARQLRKRVTAYSEDKLQPALEAGCKSVPEVMAFLAKRDAQARANSAIGAKRSRATYEAVHGNFTVRRRA